MKKVILACLFALSGSASAIVITTTTDGSLLTGVISGSGITIDGGTINYIGGSTQGGTFTDGLSSGIGIENGIILTSGDATLAPGPNTATGTTGIVNSLGDADLLALPIPGMTDTFDANILEFEFTTTTGDLFFNFVFASEEYNEFLNFPDPFGLFIDGVNFALAPDSQAVSVGTVNCGPTGTGTGPNCSSFNNNTANVFNIEYDGFTDVFTASILGLGAGTHTMKFAIADANDAKLDSAVFIEAGSFSGTKTVPEPTTLALLSLGIMGIGFSRKKRKILKA